MSLNFTRKDKPQPEHLIPKNKDLTVPLFLENNLFQVCKGTKVKLWCSASYPGGVSNHSILLHIAAAFQKPLKPHMSFSPSLQHIPLEGNKFLVISVPTLQKHGTKIKQKPTTRVQWQSSCSLH